MTNKTGRAQVGIGTLIVLLTMVVVAAIAAGVLINTTGVLAGQSGGDGTPADGTTGLVVVGQTGTVVDGAVGVVNLTVVRGPNAESVDLRDVTVSWVGPSGSYNVVHDDAAGGSGDGTFRVTALAGDGGSPSVLDSQDRRVVLTLDLGSGDGVGGDPFGDELGPGDQARLTITTGDGVSTTVRLATPRSFAGQDAVVL